MKIGSPDGLMGDFFHIFKKDIKPYSHKFFWRIE